jgi:hypothetical protein
MTPKGLKLCGYTVCSTTPKASSGNVAEPHHHTRIPSRIVALFASPQDIALLTAFTRRFFVARNELRTPISRPSVLMRLFTGSGRPMPLPIVEINPRTRWAA